MIYGQGCEFSMKLNRYRIKAGYAPEGFLDD